MRSRISSKLIFATCVGYFDRACYGLYVTLSRMLILNEGQNLTAVELSECTNTKYVAMDMYATLFILVGRNIINSSMRRGDK